LDGGSIPPSSTKPLSRVKGPPPRETEEAGLSRPWSTRPPVRDAHA